MKLKAEDLDALKDAVNILENPGLAVQITNLIGKPIEYGMSKLPSGVSQSIHEATSSALLSSLRVAVSTMSNKRGVRASNSMHKAFSSLSGAVGGAFGLPALAIELPVSTTIMLRSMADIARGHLGDAIMKRAILSIISAFLLSVSRHQRSTEL